MKKQHKCLIRRIRKGEIEKLIEIQSEAKEINDFFNNHTEWLDKALEEIIGNNRIAFGAFQTFVDEKSQTNSNELISSVIVKKGEFSNQLELKNLVFNQKPYQKYTNFDLEDIKEIEKDVKRQLIEKVTNFCERRGYESLETEFPSIFNDDISILLSCGFQVLSIREKYGTGKYVNVLEKKLGEIYQGDPFDLNRMIEWGARHFFPFKKKDYREAYFSDDSSLLLITSLCFSISPKFSQTKLLSESNKDLVSIKGEFTIDLFNENIDPLLKNPEHFFSPTSDLKYLVSDKNSEALTEICEQNKIKFLSLELLKKMFGGNKSSLKIPFNKNDVAGIITLLEPEHIKNFEKFDGEFVYFLLSGLGSSLSHLDDELHILIFYAPPNEDFKGGFWGYADIESIHITTYEKANEFYPDHVGRIISEEDLIFYKTYSENEKVIVLKCINFVSFDIPIDPEKISEKQLRDYIQSELNVENASSVYINWSLNRFIKSQSNSVSKPQNMSTHYNKKDNPMKKGIDWTSFIIETGKGIPYLGSLLFGGFQKLREDKKNDEKFTELNNKIDMLIERNQDITKSSLKSILEHYIDEDNLQELTLDISVDIVNTTVNQSKRIGQIPTSESIVSDLRISRFPLPVEENIFRKEMIQLYGNRNNIKSFRYALESVDFDLDVTENEIPKNEVLIFCKSLKGKDLKKIYLIFEEFYQNHPHSIIIKDIFEYLTLIRCNEL